MSSAHMPQVGPKSSDKYPYKGAEKEQTDREEKVLEAGGRGCSEAATAWKAWSPHALDGARKQPPSGLETVWPCGYPDFRLQASRTLRGLFLSFHHPVSL